MINSIKKYLVRRKAIRELESLTDRELRDIGIHRTNIKNVV